MERLEFDSRDALTEKLAGEVVARLKKAIEDKGEAGLAVFRWSHAGGSV